MRTVMVGACLSLAWLVSQASAVPREQPPSSAQAKTAGLLYDRVEAVGARLEERLELGDIPHANLARSSLAANERQIDTDVAIRVQERVKGSIPGGALVYVRLPGGAHRFPDGRTARQVITGFRAVRPDATYVMYLRPIDAPEAARTGEARRVDGRPRRAQFELAVGPQGLFELDFDRDVVVPAALHLDHPLAMRYATMPVAEFLTELHGPWTR
jgi:hypothetical protein